jgi:uncharacterized membrane protein
MRYNNDNQQPVLPINLDKNERLISLGVGGLMVAYGLVRLPLTAVMALIAGSYFLYRAIKGYCPIYAQLGLDKIKPAAAPRMFRTAQRQLHDAHDAHYDAVDAALNQTFPTSDPPAWTMGRGEE